jgi:hypothetical protein
MHQVRDPRQTENIDLPQLPPRITLGLLDQEYQVNLRTVVIFTTEDKLRLHLTNSTYRKEPAVITWLAPLGLLVAFALPLGTTATFNAWIWRDLTFMGAVASFLWLLVTIVLTRRARSHKSETLDELIERIKKEPH